MEAATTSVTSVMTNLAKNIPMHTWLGALPQLISRMCHPCKEVSELAKSIIVRITQVGGCWGWWTSDGGAGGMGRREVVHKQGP